MSRKGSILVDIPPSQFGGLKKNPGTKRKSIAPDDFGLKLDASLLELGEPKSGRSILTIVVDSENDDSSPDTQSTVQPPRVMSIEIPFNTHDTASEKGSSRFNNKDNPQEGFQGSYSKGLNIDATTALLSQHFSIIREIHHYSKRFKDFLNRGAIEREQFLDLFTN